MKKLIYIFLLLVLSSALNSQTVERFKSDFSKIDASTCDENDMNYFYKIYLDELTPYNYPTRLREKKYDDYFLKYPFRDLINDSIYKNRIEEFFNSENEDLLTFTYFTISAVGDKSFEKRMLERLSSADENAIFNLCISLLHLETDKTSELFEYLKQDSYFNNKRMLEYYSRLNKDSLRNTAYLHFNDDSPEAKKLAYLFLTLTELNDKTEKLLKQAVVNADFNDKYKIIKIIKELQVGNLKGLLYPLLDSSQTRGISLQALANSPTKDDRQVVFDLVDSLDTLDKSLLFSLMSSKNIEFNKLWLKVIQTNKASKDIFFTLFEYDAYLTDELLPLVQEMIEDIENWESLSRNISLLGSRRDEKSLNIIFDAMRHKDLKVRESATYCLLGNPSELIKEEVKSIILDSSLRTKAIVDLAIEHNLNSYHSIFENQFKYNDDLYWRRTSIEYLSIFPLKRHIPLFKSILSDSKGDRYAKYRAAIGLGNLNDSSSIDLIIEACDEESKGRDYNAMSFMKALGKLKGEKAKAHLILHKDSDDNEVRELIYNILKDWGEE